MLRYTLWILSSKKSCSENFMCIVEFGKRTDVAVHFFRDVMISDILAPI